MNFLESPAYQRAVQRLGRIRPEQRAILNTLSVDAEFADEETRRTLQSMALESDKSYRDESISLRRSGLGLRKEAFDISQKKDRMATGVGVGQVFAESYFGGKREELDMALLKRKMRFMDRLEKKYGG